MSPRLCQYLVMSPFLSSSFELMFFCSICPSHVFSGASAEQFRSHFVRPLADHHQCTDGQSAAISRENQARTSVTGRYALGVRRDPAADTEKSQPTNYGVITSATIVVAIGEESPFRARYRSPSGRLCRGASRHLSRGRCTWIQPKDIARGLSLCLRACHSLSAA